ncbi:MAG: aminoglycoside phosphotransferase family protein [Myxococcota bacterium]
MNVEPPPSAVLEHWPIDDAEIEPITFGHINRTYLVRCSFGRFVLQRVAPIFGPEIHQDIYTVTRRLLERGVPTPTLVRTEEGQLYVEEDGVWRLQTFAPGTTYLRVTDSKLAASAATLLARFHGALSDLDYEFKNTRTGIHDTAKHSAALTEALGHHRDHRAYDAVAPLAEDLQRRWGTLGDFSHLPERPVHGDPKISNVLFDESKHAHCMVDLDTLGRMPVVLELGDAFRSWCNRGDEDGEAARFDPEIFRAAMNAYAQAAGDTFTAEERSAVVDGTQTIALELAMRFAADALNESYFGWDAQRFESASAHNLQRARNQAALAQSIEEQRAILSP